MSLQGDIRVFALNPSIDVEWRTGPLRSEEKNELLGETRWPGGKGVNVIRWLHWCRVPATLFIPLGGSTGDELRLGLEAERLRFDSYPLTVGNRVNYLVTPSEGPQYRFNATWPKLSSVESRALRNAAEATFAQARMVVFSGTLPFGAPADTYAWLVRKAVKQGLPVILDCDREPFARAVEQHPRLVKPNEFELGQWAGTELKTEREVECAAIRLSDRTGGWVLVTRGAKGGLLVHSGDRLAWSALPPSVTPRNTVGAGDATVAGMVAAMEFGSDPSVWLQRAIGTGTSATQAPPGKLPTMRAAKALMNAVQIRERRSLFR